LPQRRATPIIGAVQAPSPIPKSPAAAEAAALARSRAGGRLWRWIVGLAVALALLVYVVVHFVSPLPPRTLVMSTGVDDGAYHQFGKRYQEILRGAGVRLELRPSSGSPENVERLQEGRAAVAFVQGGIAPAPGAADAEEATPLRSLACVAFEPVWIFTTTLDVSRGLDVLAGKRVEVGVPNSGNMKVAMDLLKVYGVSAGSERPSGASPGTAATIYTDGGMTAGDKLRHHEVDAVILVAAAQAASVQQLLTDESVHLASLDHVEGLSRRFAYLQPVSLKRGSVDPGRDLPSHDIELLATEANLVAREDLHPALVYLLLKAAQQVHGSSGLLNRPGDFPAARGTDYPLADAAERYFRNGPPFLQSYMPFWAAIYLQRLLLLILPFLAILFPLARLMPELIAWRRNTKLYRWYGELKFLEQELESRSLGEEERRAAAARLDRIEGDIAHARFPLELSDRVYTLREHVAFVREQIARAGSARR
jgi:TRAP transporter TAXI family solute receptor